MDTSSIAYTTVSRLPATRVDFGSRFSRESNLGVGDSRISVRPRNSCRRLSCQFSDSGHIQYYVSPRVGGGNRKKEKEKSSEINQVKKKLKFIKRLSEDLSMLPQMADGENIGIGLIGEVKEARELLLAQLQQLRSEQKEVKRKLKEEGTRLKAALEKPESSSSSESRDSECGEVVDMKTMRSDILKPSKDKEAPSENALRQPEDIKAGMVLTEEAKLADSLMELENSDSSPQFRVRVPCSGFGSERCSSNGSKDDHSDSLPEVASTKQIEICTGGKCKRLGAAALLEEFERKVGAEGTVVACKCMGKCKTAPNVRVLNSPSRTEVKSNEDSFILGINPICTGVGLQDVDLIVANLMGKDIEDECLMLSS